MKVRFVKPEAVDPERDRGLRVPYAPAKRNLARWRWYLILLVVTSPFLFIVGESIYSSALIQAPGFVAQEQLAVRASSTGYVDEVYVKALDAVEAGAPLIKISNDALATRAAQLRAELKELHGVAASARSEGGFVAQAPLDTEDFAGALDSARAEKERLHDRFDQMQTLLDQGAATEAEVNAARGQYEQSSARLDELYRTMTVQTQPPPSAPRSNAPRIDVQTRILAIQTELESLDGQLAAMTVRATRAGRIVDLAVVKGDQMAPGSKIAMLAPTGGALHVNAYIPPKNSVFASPGTRASVIFPDGTRRPAVVADVPQVAADVPQSQTSFGESERGVLVRMRFVDVRDANEQPLSDGLPVRVEFENAWRVSHDNPLVRDMRQGIAALFQHLSRST